MPPPATNTINEVDFCAKIASAANAISATMRDTSPFIEARVEGIGSTGSKRARKDLPFYGPNNEIVQTGEVKRPRGVGAFDSNEVKNAHDKAELRRWRGSRATHRAFRAADCARKGIDNLRGVS